MKPRSNRRRFAGFVAALAMVAACESTPQKREVSTANQPVAARPAIDGAALIQTAETLRDREFAARPTVQSVDGFEAAPLAGCEGRCDEERRWLTRVLFGGKGPVVPAALARWDRASNVVTFDGGASAAEAQSAVLAELVRALDQFTPPPSKSWDAYLASCALRRGAGVFVAALERAQQRSGRVDAARLALRPEGLYDLKFGANRFTDGFATREGFAFVAALMRSGGWSAVELAHNEPPRSTLQIVRPDRYLAGDQPGQWTLPPELESNRTGRGLTLAMDGVVGPALFVEWLSRHVPAAVARAAYIGFESDRYRIFSGEGGQWSFEWVALWNTPATAQQVVEALDAGLRQRDDGAKFAVFRKGATVAVVGESGGDSDLAVLGTTLVDTLPTFAPGRPRGVEFVPTPVDRIQSRPQVSSIAAAAWKDAVTGVSVDLGTLTDQWKILPTTEPNLPWFAKHSGGAVLQYMVEPVGLLDPPFADQAYADAVRERFVATMDLGSPATVTRSDGPTAGSLVIDAEGKIKDRAADGPIHLRAWHFESGPFLMTLSLQAPPAQFAELLKDIEPLVASIETAQPAEKTDAGIIRFQVEDE